MYPTQAQKNAAALAAAVLISALQARGISAARAAKAGADLLLLDTGLLSPAEEEALARALVLAVS